MEGFGEKSYENLMVSLEESQTHTARLCTVWELPILDWVSKVICKAFDYDIERLILQTQGKKSVTQKALGSRLPNLYRIF